MTTTKGAREVRGFDVPDDPDVEPIDLAARDRGPDVERNKATTYAIQLRNAISSAVREESDEFVLQTVARCLGMFWDERIARARALEER